MIGEFGVQSLSMPSFEERDRDGRLMIVAAFVLDCCRLAPPRKGHVRPFQVKKGRPYARSVSGNQMNQVSVIAAYFCRIHPCVDCCNHR